MISQKTVFGVNEQTITQLKLKQYINNFHDLTASEKDSTSVSAQNFLDTDNPTTPVTNQSTQTEPVRESIKHMLIGSPKAVTHTIAHLQVLGYASVGDWSPLLPSPNPGEVMSILVRKNVIC